MAMLSAALLIACSSPAPSTPVPFAPEPDELVEPLALWPSPGSVLVHPVIEVPDVFAQQKVFIVAGHGAGRANRGNLGAWCTREEDFTLQAADRLADTLDATGIFDAVRGRTASTRPSYDSRLAHLQRSGATSLIELHSDARANNMVPNGADEAGEVCYRDDGEPGFTVLVRDRGPPKLVQDRLHLARSVALALSAAGFPAWNGDNYGGLYQADAEVPGVWFDRRGLKMLRSPEVPSIIIETHNAKDGLETRRWEEPGTHRAFGRAMIAALIDYYG